MSTEPDEPNETIPGALSPDDPTWRPPQTGGTPERATGSGDCRAGDSRAAGASEVRYVIRAFDTASGVADVQYEDGTRNLSSSRSILRAGISRAISSTATSGR